MSDSPKVFVSEKFGVPILDLVYDTIKKGKQCLVFVNTKQRAEKTAETIVKKLKLKFDSSDKLASEVLSVLPKPTKQCERLAYCLKGGVAFHHSGLVAKQRSIIEENFRKGIIKVICCTPTLAYGVDLPAFRVIIRDLKRYGYHGMDWIPVLEIQQMFGRAGRPSYDSEGQAICFSTSESEKRAIVEHFILGRPEEIYSKLAVEPVFRTYLLSLIATGIVRTRKDLEEFFKETFWAFQFEDFDRIKDMINRTLAMLRDWGFIEGSNSDFVSAFDVKNTEREVLKTTLLGRRVAELYLDPLTAHRIIVCLGKKNRKLTEFSMVQMCTHTLELRPYLRVKVKEFEDFEARVAEFEHEILEDIPNVYDEDYDEFLNSFKTSLVFYEWMNEADDEFLFEKYSIRPGELRSKLLILDWLLYAVHEIAKILKMKGYLNLINKTRLRLKYGVKPELLNLLRLDGIGRVRARKLYNNNIRTIGDVRRASVGLLSKIVGQKVAENVKKQLNQLKVERKPAENLDLFKK